MLKLNVITLKECSLKVLSDFDPFQPSVVFHIETTFYIKYNTGLKLVKSYGWLDFSQLMKIIETTVKKCSEK